MLNIEKMLHNMSWRYAIAKKNYNIPLLRPDVRKFLRERISRPVISPRRVRWNEK